MYVCVYVNPSTVTSSNRFRLDGDEQQAVGRSGGDGDSGGWYPPTHRSPAAEHRRAVDARARASIEYISVRATNRDNIIPRTQRRTDGRVSVLVRYDHRFSEKTLTNFSIGLIAQVLRKPTPAAPTVADFLQFFRTEAGLRRRRGGGGNKSVGHLLESTQFR